MRNFAAVLMGLVGTAFFAYSMAGFWSYLFTERLTTVTEAGSRALAGVLASQPMAPPPEPSLVLPIVFMLGALLCWGGAVVVVASAPRRRRPRVLQARRR